MTRVFRKRVKPRKFQKGNLVLKVLRGLISDPRGKFRLTWSGLFVIRYLTREGAGWLTDLDENQFTEPVNVDQLKKFYVRSWSGDGWPSLRVAIFPIAHPYIDISYCYPFEPHAVYYGLFFFIQPYLTWVGGLPLCTLYLLIGS